MDVHLLVYDLSNGLARQFSRGMLGFQLDAVYHTSIELEGVEYVYDAGINTIKPGSSHLGRPLQRILLGRTDLPHTVIAEFIDSMREVFTPQAYDLFRHNCNNFSNEFSMFLLGTGIPGHIANMPQAVLETPLGMMLEHQLKAMVEQKKAQQTGFLGIQNDQSQVNGAASASAAVASSIPTVVEDQANGTGPAGAATVSLSLTVTEVSNAKSLDAALADAALKSAIIFFASATCVQSKGLSSAYDRLAAEQRGVSMIKVDISVAQDVAKLYEIATTPVFVTYLHGKQQERWSGSDETQLRSATYHLGRMAAKPLHPLQLNHPHERLHIPQFGALRTILFKTVPPLPKLLSKLGPTANDAAVQSMKQFIEVRSSGDLEKAALPDLDAFSNYAVTAIGDLPRELLFAVVDLLRYSLVDPRVSSYYAEEPGHKTVMAFLESVNSDRDSPYPLRLTVLHMACNIFSSSLFSEHIFDSAPLRTAIIQLISTSLLDSDRSTIWGSAASLLNNVALQNLLRRRGLKSSITEEEGVELAAAILEGITRANGESSADALHGMLMALSLLIYCTPVDGDLYGLLEAMEAQKTIMGKMNDFPAKSASILLLRNLLSAN